MRAAAALCMAWIYHAGIVEGEDLLCLQPVRQESAGQGLAHDDRHHRVAGDPGGGVGVHGGGDGLMQPGHFLDPAVGLAGQVDHRDDCPPLRGGGVLGHHLADGLGQCQALGQSDLTGAGAVERVVRIRHDRQVVRRRRCRRAAPRG